IMAQRLEPFEDGADGVAAFSHAFLKERERFGRWLLSEDMSMALNGLLVLTGRLRRLLRHERKRLVEEEGEAKRRALFPEAAEAPKCPICGSPMRLRTAKTGTNAGSRFWGCTQYPACRGVREIVDGNA
ncbi:MAG: topoisomerase DNA-binding C4 zinc finger domain-containing protein, partial [Victivallales bacterium]|nr:topoisomerase DNA-binding C4 zinc finger domain-containing protein [Victivallales bacterium]